MKLPRAKTDNIVVQDLKYELLIYNLATNQAYTLNETAKTVFNLCDGQTSFDELKRRSAFTDEIIYLALDGLQKKEMLESDYISPFAHLSRREAIRKVGLASMIALPIVASMVAPTAAMAQSGGPVCFPCTIDIGFNCNNPAGGCTSVRYGLPCHPSCTSCACTVPNGSSSCSSVCVPI